MREENSNSFEQNETEISDNHDIGGKAEQRRSDPRPTVNKPIYHNRGAEHQYSAWESSYQKQSPPDPDNRTPWEEGPRQTKRKHNRAPLILIVALTLIIGLSLFVRFSLQNDALWHIDIGSLPVPSAFIAETQTDVGETTVARAEVGGGTVLKIAARPTQALKIQDVYKQVSPSVVSISGTLSDAISYGTGIIMSADGYIITNYHVIEGCSTVTVTLPNDEEYNALLVGSDSQTDLAVLKIDSTDLPAAEFGDSGALVVGDSVYAIGNPLGIELKGTLTDGIISAINRDIYVDGRTMTLLQTNAALNSGNSGGPLINVYGQIIGINTIKMSSYYSTIEGLGFAIPISSAKPIVDELIENGFISGRSVIGITASDLSETAAAFYSTIQGVYVESVDTRSDAYRVGIRSGDIIVKINGETVLTMDDLYAIKEGFGVGDTITITVYRNRSYTDYDVVLMDAADLS